MRIHYKFISDIEPTDEQLHLLMKEVAIEAKRNAQESDEHFFEQLQQLLRIAQEQQIILRPELK